MYRFDWRNADKRLLYMLPSKKPDVDGNLDRILCYFVFLHSDYVSSFTLVCSALLAVLEMMAKQGIVLIGVRPECKLTGSWG